MENHNLGKAAEKRAISYLKNNGYQILQQNYRYRKAEVDIIAQLGNTLIIVEVKPGLVLLLGILNLLSKKRKSVY